MPKTGSLGFLKKNTGVWVKRYDSFFFSHFYPRIYLSTHKLQISCSVQAKHNIVGARTEKRRSQDLVAGLDVNQGSGTVSVKEGGGVVSIPVRSSVPVLCPPQDRAFGECCLHLELALREVEEEQLCPQGNVMDRVSSVSCQFIVSASWWARLRCCRDKKLMRIIGSIIQRSSRWCIPDILDKTRHFKVFC